MKYLCPPPPADPQLTSRMSAIRGWLAGIRFFGRWPEANLHTCTIPCMCENCISHNFPRHSFGSLLDTLDVVSASFICVSRGGSLTSNNRSERNVAGKSHRQSEVPCQCICHIEGMASGVAAETRHKVLRVTEALLPPPDSLSPHISLSDLPSLSFAVTAFFSAWPLDMTQVPPRAAAEGAVWWSGTVKISVTWTSRLL